MGTGTSLPLQSGGPSRLSIRSGGPNPLRVLAYRSLQIWGCRQGMCFAKRSSVLRAIVAG